jgi:hypothetical protein
MMIMIGFVVKDSDNTIISKMIKTMTMIYTDSSNTSRNSNRR